jgi:hypothetical protein
MAGPSGGTWKLVDGKAIGVFGMGAEVDAQVCVGFIFSFFPLFSPAAPGLSL